jgi:hypothetical protein
MRKGIIAAGVLATVLAVLGAWNYFGVYGPATSAMAKDARNETLSARVHRQYGLSPSTIVFDLRDLKEEGASTDVMRALFQSAEALKDSRFERVVLAYEGTPKFYLQGEYFQTLGKEFGTNNPMYLVRTLPENVYKLDGDKAFGTWTGGLLGVTMKQLEDLNELAKQWYLADWVASKR